MMGCTRSKQLVIEWSVHSLLRRYNKSMTQLPLPTGLTQQLEALGGQLVWRIGKDELSDAVVVRLGFASATPRFSHLPRLRSANDAELQTAVEAGQIVIEWVD